MKSGKKRPAAQVKASPSASKPVLQMKKYVVPKAKPAGSGDSTNEPINSQDDKKKCKVETEVEYFDVLYTKHLHQKTKVWDDGFLEYHVVP